MICGTNDYGVAIHSGRHNLAGHSLDYDVMYTWYLFALESGVGSFDGQELRPPRMLLIPPCSGRLLAPAGAEWQIIAFDLLRVPLQRRHKADGTPGHSFCHAHKAPQPDGLALWGTTPPIEIPEDERPAALNCLRSCGRQYWRSATNWAKANAQLQLWVTEYATKGRGKNKEYHRIDWLGSILNEIKDGLSSGISVAECARIAGMNRSTFYRRFTVAMSETPSDYILRQRMEKAARLLEGDKDDIARVARLVGYHSPETFSNQFLKYHGCRPSRYRLSVRPS